MIFFLSPFSLPFFAIICHLIATPFFPQALQNDLILSSTEHPKKTIEKNFYEFSNSYLKKGEAMKFTLKFYN